MIVYGTKAVHLHSEQSPTASCPSCGTKGSLVFSVFRKHAHVFWIPFFPIGKKVISQCQHCKNLLEGKEMSEELKQEAAPIKDGAKGPIWQFSGLALLVLLIFWGNHAGSEKKSNELTYLNNPMPGDVYHYRLSTGNYSTLKVVNVLRDSVFVVPNNYEINKRSRLYKIEKPENYSTASYGLSKADLKAKYSANEIFLVFRFE